MERALTQDERIRRAEEIYARRQNIREKTKKATVNVSEPKNFKMVKRIILQITICVLMYFIFYLINTTNYSFSEEVLNKTEELLLYNEDFISIGNSLVSTIKEYIFSTEIKNTEENIVEENIVDENTEENNIEEQATTQIIESDVIVAMETEETIGQSEIQDVNLSETDRIKQQYSFILPLSGTVSSEFGEREATSSIMSTYHKGIDIAANTGTSIVASTDGEVSVSRYSSSYGNYIIIENNEIKTVYAHCSELLVAVRR